MKHQMSLFHWNLIADVQAFQYDCLTFVLLQPLICWYFSYVCTF